MAGYGSAAHRIFSFEPWFRRRMLDDAFSRDELESEAERVIAFLGGSA